MDNKNLENTGIVPPYILDAIKSFNDENDISLSERNLIIKFICKAKYYPRDLSKLIDLIGCELLEELSDNSLIILKHVINQFTCDVQKIHLQNINNLYHSLNDEDLRKKLIKNIKVYNSVKENEIIKDQSTIEKEEKYAILSQVDSEINSLSKFVFSLNVEKYHVKAFENILSKVRNLKEEFENLSK